MKDYSTVMLNLQVMTEREGEVFRSRTKNSRLKPALEYAHKLQAHRSTHTRKRIQSWLVIASGCKVPAEMVEPAAKLKTDCCQKLRLLPGDKDKFAPP